MSQADRGQHHGQGGRGQAVGRQRAVLGAGRGESASAAQRARNRENALR